MRKLADCLLLTLTFLVLLVHGFTQSFAQTAISFVPQTPHAGRIGSIAFSPDGSLLLTVGEDNSIRLWDVAEQSLLRVFVGHAGIVRNAVFSPDGREIMSQAQNEDYSIRFWDVETGRQLAAVYDRDSYAQIAPWSAYLAGSNSYVSLFGSHATIRSRGSDSIRHKLFVAQGDSTSAAVAQSGMQLLVADETEGVGVWDTRSGKKVGSFGRLSGIPFAASISPNGKKFLIGDNQGATFEVDMKSKKKRLVSNQRNPIYFSKYSHDGTKIITGDAEGNVQVLSAPTLKTLKRYSGLIGPMALSPQANILAVGSPEGIKVVDLESGDILTGFGKPALTVTSLAYSKEAQRLVSGDSKGALTLWNPVSARRESVFKTYMTSINSVAADQATDRLIVATKKGPLDLLRISKPAELHRLLANSDVWLSASPTGRYFTSAGADSAALWDLDTRKEIKSFQGREQASLSPDGEVVAFDDYGIIQLHTFNGHPLEISENGSGLSKLVFSPNNDQLAIARFDPAGGSVQLRNWRLNRELARFDIGYDRTDALAFSPTGETFSSGGMLGIIRVWSALGEAAYETFKLSGHSGAITSLTYSPDGTRLYSASDDGTIKIWSLQTGALLATIIPTERGGSVTITPEGFFDATPEAAKTLKVVKGLDVYSIDQFYSSLFRPDLVEEKIGGDIEGVVAAAADGLDMEKLLTAGPPPILRFTDLNPPVREGKVDLDIELKDAGGGIGKLEWRINGVTSGISTRGLARVQSGPSRRETKSLFLQNGLNHIEVIAYNSNGSIASDPVSLELTVANSEALRPRLFVLAVGVNAYFDSKFALNYAVPDAIAISKAFEKAGQHFEGGVQIVKVLDEKATVAGIGAAFEQVANEARPNDTFVFYLAGHGKTVDGRYYFVPYDFLYKDENSFSNNAIDQDQFQSWLAMVPSQKSMVLLDTCESGSMTGLRVAARGLQRAVAFEKMTRALGRTTIAASTDDAPALEGFRGHGVFTYAFLEGLGKADTDKDSQIDVLEIMSWLDKSVPEYSFREFKQRQIPQSAFVGSNFKIGTATVGLVESSSSASAIAASQSRFVVVAPSEVFAKPDLSGQPMEHLSAGTLVTIRQVLWGNAEVERNGRTLGYIKHSNLLKVE
jgi:WD40 repeat protein